MGAAKRLMKFGLGGVLGAAVGTAVGILFAPQSGDELKEEVAERVRAAQVAGAEAQAAKEAELVQKFRVEVGDPDALQRVAIQARVERREAVAAIGLGLNAPGALAAQELALRREAGTAPLEVAAPPERWPEETTPLPPANTPPRDTPTD